MTFLYRYASSLMPRGLQPVAFALILLAALPLTTQAQPGTVGTHQKISDTEGSFSGSLDNGNRFGSSATALGDLDGDGVTDLAVGAVFDNDGGAGRGAVWILFLNADGTVKGHQKISDTEGDFTGTLADYDQFGHAVAGLGDLDGDTVSDLVVVDYPGTIWVLFLNTDGTVKGHNEIVGTGGSSVAALGDLDGDDVTDLAVGDVNDLDGNVYGFSVGAVHILFLNADGTVKGQQKISATAGGFTGLIEDGDVFGGALSPLGDLDGDTIPDLAVGAWGDDDGGAWNPYTGQGAVWVLFLNADGTVKGHQKISTTAGGFTGPIQGGSFSSAVAAPGDLNGDTVPDLAVGSPYDSDGGSARGAVWMLFLNPDGTVKGEQKISGTAGGFTGALDSNDYFGYGLAALGDLNGDGVADLASGAIYDDDGGVDNNANRGAVWMLFLESLFDLAVTPLDRRGGDPVGAPVALPSGGGKAFYRATALNTTDTHIDTDFWPSVELPDGRVVTRRNPFSIAVPASGEGTLDSGLNFNGGLPSGTYTLRFYVGTHSRANNDRAVAMATFDVEKAAARWGAPTLSEREIAQMDFESLFEVDVASVGTTPDGELPTETVLGQGYPNPFNPTATVPFTLSQDGDVRLAVYDLLGREVAVLVQGPMAAGSHTAVFDAGQLSSGTYLVRFSTQDGGLQTQRLTLLK